MYYLLNFATNNHKDRSAAAHHFSFREPGLHQHVAVLKQFIFIFVQNFTANGKCSLSSLLWPNKLELISSFSEPELSRSASFRWSRSHAGSGYSFDDSVASSDGNGLESYIGSGKILSSFHSFKSNFVTNYPSHCMNKINYFFKLG
jgi:hypothetical protein